MGWNEEETQKSHLFGDLKPKKIAIDFGWRICQNGEKKIRNQGVYLMEGHTDKT